MPKENMGKKYYCEYCDKSFADNPVNRRNHMRGTKHRQSRRMHYDSLRGMHEMTVLSPSKLFPQPNLTVVMGKVVTL